MVSGIRAAGSVVALAAAGLALSACGGSTPAKSSTPTTRSTPRHTTTTVTGAPATTSTGAPTTTGPAATTSTTTTPTTGSTICQPSQLTGAVTGSEGAAGTIEMTFSLTDTSTAACTLRGYPGMQLLGPTGSQVPTTVRRGGALDFEQVAVTPVSLSPGQVAYLNLGYSTVMGQPTACSVATSLEITPPTDTGHVLVTAPSIHACEGGLLDVSPVFGATDAAGTSTTAPPS